MSMFEQHKSPEVSFNCAGTSDAVNFSTWNGSLKLGIYDTKQRGKAKQSVNISTPLRLLLIKTLTALRSAPAETKKPFVCTKWDEVQRKHVPHFTLNLIKDPSMCYHIELLVGGSSFKALMRGPSNISVGSEPMTDAVKSSIALEELIEYLEKIVPIETTVYREKFNPNKQGGMRSQGGQRPPQSDAAPAATGGDSDYSF